MPAEQSNRSPSAEQELGFYSEKYLYRVFRNHTAIPPPSPLSGWAGGGSPASSIGDQRTAFGEAGAPNIAARRPGAEIGGRWRSESASHGAPTDASRWARDRRPGLALIGRALVQQAAVAL